MTNPFNIPIVVIIYNRPSVTRELIQKLSLIKPVSIYIIADGPRELMNKDQELCLETRKIIDRDINWHCKVQKKYSDNNLGCGKSISSGLTWVFEKEEYAIILEDDCIPAISFFSFCEELLIKFRYDTRVMHICGTRWNPERCRSEISYFFSRYSHVWGWATWSRAWKLFDYEIKTWPIVKNSNYLNSVFESKKEVAHFTKVFDNYYNNSLKPGWATQWSYSVIVNNGLVVVPNSNLISNKGEIGTHSSNMTYFYNRPVDEDFIIRNHPKIMIIDKWFDNYHSKKHILKRTNFTKRVINYLERLISK